MEAFSTSEIINGVIAGIITIIIGIVIQKIIERRSRLVYYLTNIANFRVSHIDPPLTLYFHSLVIRNQGKKEAQDIEICHGFPIRNYNLYPNKSVEFKESANPNNPIMVIDSLAPGEIVTISYLDDYPHDLNYLYQYIKWREGLAKQILVAPQQIFPKWMITGLWLLMLWGIFCLVYLLYKLVS